MRLQKQLSRKIGNKKYAKWVVTIPPEDVSQLGWKEGQSLKTILHAEGLLILKSEELTYAEFKNRISDLLARTKTGLTWQEIKSQLILPQAVPNNAWVRKLEKEIGLKRRKDEGKTYWYIPHQKDTTIFTIGYEGKTPEEFLVILKKNNIQQLVDVRKLALSRKNGFAKSQLSKILRQNGIVYKHYPSLGSPREIRHKLWREGNYPKFFKEYSEALSRPESQEHLIDLEGIAQVRKTVIMCFEKDPAVCHRSIITEKLKQDGFGVINL